MQGHFGGEGGPRLSWRLRQGLFGVVTGEGGCGAEVLEMMEALSVWAAEEGEEEVEGRGGGHRR